MQKKNVFQKLTTYCKVFLLAGIAYLSGSEKELGKHILLSQGQEVSISGLSYSGPQLILSESFWNLSLPAIQEQHSQTSTCRDLPRWFLKIFPSSPGLIKILANRDADKAYLSEIPGIPEKSSDYYIFALHKIRI